MKIPFNKITVVYFREGVHWTAQCLEYDIAAQGEHLGDAMMRLSQTLIGQMILDDSKGQTPLVNIEPAPDYYWKRAVERSNDAD